jgi:hypothetical protein
MTPKAFLSYSWSSPAHQQLINEWAARLLSDGVDVVLDQYDLKEGHDKFVFMERMVTDPSVSHVLVFSDSTYVEKADARAAGVGTESQIISGEIYAKVEQSKFIPIVCAKDAEGQPCLPAFLMARIWIDFTSPEAVNDNWERLIRLLHGKPANEKPKLGKPPVYLESTEVAPASPAAAKLASLRTALLNGRAGIQLYRRAFLDECIAHVESLRVRQRPTAEVIGEKVLEDVGKLKPIRDLAADWLLLEGAVTKDDSLRDDLLEYMERLRAMKGRPPEMNQWSDSWFEAHALFVYESFLYAVAALLKVRRYDLLAAIFGNHYLLPESEGRGTGRFETFDTFWAYSESLQPVLASHGVRLLSPAAAMVQKHADRVDLPFTSVLEADALAFVISVVSETSRWYPAMLLYVSYGRTLPFFVRAAQKRHFQALAQISGLATGDLFRAAYERGAVRLSVSAWHDFGMGAGLSEILNIAQLDTL